MSVTSVNLESFDYDHLEGDLYNIAQQFHETMMFLRFTLPQGVFLDASLRYLLVSRERALDSIRNKEENDRIAASQLRLELSDTGDDKLGPFPGPAFVPET